MKTNKMVMSWRVSLYVDRVLLPKRSWRVLCYALLLPFAGCICASVFAPLPYLSLLVALSLLFLVASLWIYAHAVEKYVLKHSPLPDGNAQEGGK